MIFADHIVRAKVEEKLEIKVCNGKGMNKDKSCVNEKATSGTMKLQGVDVKKVHS